MGRPRIKKTEKKVALCITLDPKVIKKIKKLHGNVSAYIAVLIQSNLATEKE